MVETSLNVGVVTTSENEAEIICLIRSLIDSGKDYVVEMLTALGQLAGAKVAPKGGYPGWQPDADSPVMHLVRELYQELFNKTPNIMVIHAGLECGLFKKPYPNMDMVSIGPTITGPHSPDEQVHIESVGLYWKLLTCSPTSRTPRPSRRSRHACRATSSKSCRFNTGKTCSWVVC